MERQMPSTSSPATDAPLNVVPRAPETSKPSIPWLLETGSKRKLEGSASRPQQTQKSPAVSNVPVHAEQRRTKRRKHEGVRYGPVPSQESQQTSSEIDLRHAPAPRQSINHQQIEQAKAGAQLHGRKFQLNTSSCMVPSLDQLFASEAWSLPEMMVEKDKLNATKDLLDCKDIKPWGAHTSFTNRAGNVVRHIRQTQGAVELCTTAWAKMYESIVTFDLLPGSGTLPNGSAAMGRVEGGGPAVGTVHLCEAPGAFISATNHFIRSQRPEWHWEWIGNSLHPYYEGNDPAAMIDDDALIQATLQHWHWGQDGSGDIRRPENVAAICASAGAMAKDLGTGGAMLVTADGSIDCQENPNEQEMSTAALHYCEMVTALGVLSPGGSFILKAFTLFEHPTVCALHLMGALFHEIYVYKPATSKPGNSETYIIGKQFKGINPDLHSFLVSHVGEDVYKDKALLSLDCLPDDFLQSCIQCAAYFAGVQQQVISDNLATDSFLPPPHRAAINAAKQWLAAEWPRHFRLKPLTRDRFLAPHVFLSGCNNNTSHPVHKREKHDGTLAERVVLGKRRREQPGIQTASDRQHQQSSLSRSNIASGAFAGSGPKGLAVAAAPGALDPNGPGRPVGVAESMMQKWGYTEGMGLGKDLQGMAHKLDPTPNKGKAGLGLGQDHPQESFGTPKYNPHPDTAILTHDHAVLSFEEMEWWRIMEQRKPAKLLRSKFLPQDDILVALRSARELGQTWVESQVNSSKISMPKQDQAATASDSSQKGGWLSPLKEVDQQASGCGQEHVNSPGASVSSPRPAGTSLGAAPSSPVAASDSVQSAVPGSKAKAESPRATAVSPETFCLHQGPCVAPQGRDPSPSFWHMASLDSAFSICSSAKTLPNQDVRDSSAAMLCLLDLSCHDCGAAQYVLTHGGVKVQSVQLMPSEAAQKLKADASNADTDIPILGLDLQPLPAVSTQAAAAKTEQAIPAVTGTTQTEPMTAITHAEALVGPSAVASEPVAVQSTRPITAAISAAAPIPVTYSLPSYEALKPDLKPANLVIGNLSPLHVQPGQQAAFTGGGASKGNLEGQTGGVNGQRLPLKGDSNGALGVMEAEYSRGYRARLLWECAMALSCLQPGGAFVVQLPDCLTTFTVSMVYLLMRSFTGLSLVKPFTSCAATGARFLVCLGRLDDGNVGALWLTEVMRHSEQLSSSGKIVAEFVPPSSYISIQLLQYLSRRNAALAKLQTKALQYMKDQRNNNISHDLAIQAQIALQARQQLRLYPENASPQLTTPAQQPQGLHLTALRPGLGFGPISQPSTMLFAQRSSRGEPASSHNQQGKMPLPKQPVQNNQEEQQSLQLQQQGQQQQDLPVPPGLPLNSGGLLQSHRVDVKHWQGPLCVVGHKGEEFVCDLATNTWPASLPRPVKLKVYEYMLADKAKNLQTFAQLGQMQLVQADQAKALHGFVQYLTGFRGAGKPLSQPKMAVVKTQTYTLLLGCNNRQDSSSATLQCWISQ